LIGSFDSDDLSNVIRHDGNHRNASVTARNAMATVVTGVAMVTAARKMHGRARRADRRPSKKIVSATNFVKTQAIDATVVRRPGPQPSPLGCGLYGRQAEETGWAGARPESGAVAGKAADGDYRS